MKQKEKKCAICGEKFYPYKSIQKVCSMQCSIEHQNKKIKEKSKRESTKEIPNTLTHPQWILKLETVFNKWIRLRDLKKGCISCSKPLINRTYDAGHFISKVYSFLRFSELNVHGQCVTCNRFKGSNQTGYKKGIENRLTPEQIKYLGDNKNKECRLTTPEIKELIEYYESKIKNHAH